MGFLKLLLNSPLAALAAVSLAWCLIFSGISAAEEPLSQAAYDALVRAEEFIEKGAPGEALKALDAYLAVPEPSVYALTLGAMARMETEDLDGAKTLWEKAVTLYPGKAYLKYNLAMTFFRMQDYGASILWLTRVLEDPAAEDVNKDHCRYYLALAFYSKGEPGRAEETILPISAGATARNEWICLEFYARFARKKWKQAERSILRLIQREPDNLTYWRHYRDVALSRQHLSGACALQEILLALSASRPGAVLNPAQEKKRLAQLYRQMEALPEQVRLAEQEGRVTLEIVGQMLTLCQPQKALDALEGLEKDDGISVESLWLRGRALFALDRNDQAVSRLVAARNAPLSPEEKKGLYPKEIRKKKDDLVSRSLMLAGQICWLDHQWVKAREIFRLLATQPGQAANARVLIDCVQALLDETRPVDHPSGL